MNAFSYGHGTFDPHSGGDENLAVNNQLVMQRASSTPLSMLSMIKIANLWRHERVWLGFK
jgi:hypothetical protein